MIKPGSFTLILEWAVRYVWLISSDRIPTTVLLMLQPWFGDCVDSVGLDRCDCRWDCASQWRSKDFYSMLRVFTQSSRMLKRCASSGSKMMFDRLETETRPLVVVLRMTKIQGLRGDLVWSLPRSAFG